VTERIALVTVLLENCGLVLAGRGNLAAAKRGLFWVGLRRRS